MGAVSIVEDMIERWDESQSGSVIGPAGKESGVIPPPLATAFECLSQALYELDNSVTFANHIDSWLSIARKVDEVHARIEHFSSETLVSVSLSAIHGLSQKITAEIEKAEHAWTRLCGRMEPVVLRVAECALKVQKLNPDLHANRLSDHHRFVELRAERIQRCWRELRKLRHARIADAAERLALFEAGRVMMHPNLPVTDKDKDLPRAQSGTGRRVVRK